MPDPLEMARSPYPCPWRTAYPGWQDFTPYERMLGEYRVMGIYPKGHLMEFGQANPGCQTCFPRQKWRGCRTAKGSGWPAGPWPGSTPRAANGTVFVTIEDETSDVQIIVWQDLFVRKGRQLGSNVVEDHRPGLPVGRHHQRDCHRPTRRPFGCLHAPIPRLALTLTTAAGLA